jgi:hypothetical protein
MSAKGKTEPVSLTTQYPGDLWAEMEAEIARRLEQDHRDDSMADLIREAVRKLLASRESMAKAS